MAVEPMPCTGKAIGMYFGWVWSGRCIIPAKSVGKIGNLIQSDWNQCIHHKEPVCKMVQVSYVSVVLSEKVLVIHVLCVKKCC